MLSLGFLVGLDLARSKGYQLLHTLSLDIVMQLIISAFKLGYANSEKYSLCFLKTSYMSRARPGLQCACLHIST